MTGKRVAILRISVSVALLALLFIVLPSGDLVRAIRSVPLPVWPVAISAYLAAHLAGVMKWRMLTNVSGAGLPFVAGLRAYYWGLFGNTFLPSIVGGDVLKVAVAMRSVGSRSALVLGSVMDRLLDIVAFVGIAGFGAMLSPRALDAGSTRIFTGSLTLAAVMVVIFAGVLMVPGLLGVPRRFRRTVISVRRAVRAAAARPGHVLVALLLGVSLQVVLILINVRLGRSMGIDIPLYVWLFVWPLAKIAGMLPITQGGLGVREAALAVLFAPFGVAAATAVAAGLAFQAVVISGGLVAGATVMLFRRSGNQAELAPGLRSAT